MYYLFYITFLHTVPRRPLLYLRHALSRILILLFSHKIVYTYIVVGSYTYIIVVKSKTLYILVWSYTYISSDRILILCVYIIMGSGRGGRLLYIDQIMLILIYYKFFRLDLRVHGSAYTVKYYILVYNILYCINTYPRGWKINASKYKLKCNRKPEPLKMYFIFFIPL